jgi:hypothetical protein
MADIVVPGFTEPSTARLKRRLNETSHFANQLVKHRDLGVNNNRSACALHCLWRVQRVAEYGCRGLKCTRNWL